MSKGGDFEREVSKSLTKWLTGVEKPYKFWRMPGSGGLATIHEECREMSGDIRSLSPESEFFTRIFSVECKTGYPKTSFWQHFKNLKTFGIKEFWKQACEDALKAEKRPMLIYRKKGKQIILGLCEPDSVQLEASCDLLATLPSIRLRFQMSEFPPIVFYEFYQFLNVVKPVYIIEQFGYNE
jgi:hypothetical protein